MTLVCDCKFLDIKLILNNVALFYLIPMFYGMIEFGRLTSRCLLLKFSPKFEWFYSSIIQWMDKSTNYKSSHCLQFHWLQLSTFQYWIAIIKNRWELPIQKRHSFLHSPIIVHSSSISILFIIIFVSANSNIHFFVATITFPSCFS